MNIKIEYQDSHGIISNRIYHMSRAAFVKHLAMAGQAFAPKPSKLMRTIGMFLQYSPYFQSQEYYDDYFSQPPIPLQDPTEKGQFSNLAGKALADFLTKRIDASILTVNYEAAMRIQKLPIVGSRPDLIAFSSSNQFAIEVKGFTKNGSGNMINHKTQSAAGPISINYSVACVSYNLYKEVKCKYYDPVRDDFKNQGNLLNSLSKNYYQGLADFLNDDLFYYREQNYGGETFFEIDLFGNSGYSKIPNIPWFASVKLLVPENIEILAKNGLSKEYKPFIFENENQNIYIDNDKIGISIENINGR